MDEKREINLAERRRVLDAERKVKMLLNKSTETLKSLESWQVFPRRVRGKYFQTVSTRGQKRPHGKTVVECIHSGYVQYKYEVLVL